MFVGEQGESCECWSRCSLVEDPHLILRSAGRNTHISLSHLCFEPQTSDQSIISDSVTLMLSCARIAGLKEAEGLFE